MKRTSAESNRATPLRACRNGGKNKPRLINGSLARKFALSYQDSDVVNAQTSKRYRFFRA
jgi:hypothetical protein